MTTAEAGTITKIEELIGETYGLGPEWVTLKVTGAETNGAYLVIEVRTPAGGGPPLHTHRASEVFFVVEGSFEFPTLIDGQPHAVVAEAGESVHIPGGIPHTYKNIGDDFGRLIGVVSPAAEMEGFFREALDRVADPSETPALDTQPDFSRLMAASAKYNFEFVL